MWRWLRTSEAYCTFWALAVIAVFLFTAFTIEPRLSPSISQGQQNGPENPANAQADQHANGGDFRKRTAEEAAAFYTLLLMIATSALTVVAIIQAIMFLWQLVLMREGIDDAKEAANAAKTAAEAGSAEARELKRAADATERALTEYERPWLFLEGTKINWRNTPLRTGQQRASTVGTGVLNDWLITLRFKNIGRMPAIVEDCVVKIEDKALLPPLPDYNNGSPLTIARTIAAGVIEDTQTIGPGPGRVNPLVFYGRITYKELNGRRHYTGFAMEMSWFMPACSPYNNDAYDYYD